MNSSSPKAERAYGQRSLACVWIFLIVILLAAGWRLLGITFDSLWLDEGYQSVADAYGKPLPDLLRVPDKPFVLKLTDPAAPSEMLRNFRHVDPLTPPFYQLLLNRWISVFGGADFALRMLSVVTSLFSVAAVYWLSWLLWGTRAAAFTGLVQAFSSFDVYYGQEVRMYALEELCATISCGAFFLFLLRQRSAAVRWSLLAVYAVSTWALINTHYTGLFLFACQILIGFVFVLARRNGRMLMELVVAWLVVALLWLPWFGMFRQAAAIRTASFYVARKPSLWWPVYALFLRIPANWVVFLTGKSVVAYAVPVFVSAVIILLLAAASFFLSRMRPVRAGSQWHVKLGMLWAWAFLPAAILWLIDVVENHRVIEISRYVMATAPAIYILAGVGLSGDFWNWRALRRRLPRWILNKHAAYGLLAVQLIFSGVNNVAHSFFVHQREPWRKMARTLERRCPPDELVLVSEWYDILPLDRYLTVPYRQVGVSHALGKRHMEQVLSGQQRFCLVTAQGEAILSDVPDSYRLVSTEDLGHSLHIWFYERTR